MAEENQQQQLLQMHSQTPPQLQPMQQTHQQQQPQQQTPQHQPQPQPQPQPQQQQAVSVTMSMANTMDQANAINQQNTMAMNAAMNVSQAQTMASGQVAVNNSGTPVHMTVPHLSAAPAVTPAPTAVMSQSSAQHPTMIHPAMSMAQSSLPQVQVIQPPLSSAYLQQLYTPQQPMVFPGNLTLQHAGMAGPTLQSIGPGQQLSLQLQTKTNIDPKTSVAGQTLQAVSGNKGISFSASNMMTATGQVLNAGTKASFQQQVMTAQGKPAIIHGQPQFATGNTNQTVVIGQLGVLPNQQSVFNQKTLADTQKKTYMVNQPAALQPKSPIFSTALPPHSTAQVFNGNQLKQLTSSPQLITSQSPGTVFSQAQLLGSLQAIGASLPQGISWATPGLQSPLLAQNPIFIRSQQSDMFIQSQPQPAVHLPVAAASTPLPPTSYASATLAPQKPKQGRPGSSVATQTVVTTVPTVNANTPPFRTPQIKGRPRTISSHLMPATAAPHAPQMATSQTQTSQAHSQQVAPMPAVQQKSDAANQTRPMPEMKTIEMKSIATQSKSVGVEAKQLSPPLTKTQAKVVPSVKISTESSPLTMPSSCTSVASVGVATVTYSTNTVGTDPNHSENSVSVGCEANEKAETALNQMTVQPMVEPMPPANEVKNTPDDHLPMTTHAKDRHPQKAIVKPHVLTHVIDGFIIQEGPEPFPVTRSSLLTEINPPKLQQVETPPQPVESTRGRKKRKMGFKSRKGWRKSESAKQAQNTNDKLQEEKHTTGSLVEMDEAVEVEEMESPSAGSDSSATPTQVIPQKEMEVDEVHEAPPDTPIKSPNKWSVQEVFEFIHDLAGCSDYADEFRSQEIDGQALMLLKEDHLMKEMGMKLGPALKLLSRINSIKGEVPLS